MTNAKTVAATLTVMLLGLTACGAEDASDSGEFVYQNQIFSGTTLIGAAQSGSSSTPSFSWSTASTGQKHVVCAIFSERISVKDDLISNDHKVVWLWHSGLGRGRDGNLLYEQGVPGPGQTALPSPLPGGTYYWAVWALDLGGHTVASSIENTLTVP